MKIKNRICLISAVLIVVLGLTANAQAQSFRVLNTNSLVDQGGVIIVKLHDDLRDKGLQLFAFDQLYQFNKNGLAFVGVPIQQKIDKYILYLVEVSENGPNNYDFYYTHVQVREKNFGMPRYVGPVPKSNPLTNQRRAQEEQIKNDAYNSANLLEDYMAYPFEMPLSEIIVTSEFGKLRLYGPRNRRTKKITIQRQAHHFGVDLRARTPLPVRAINKGTVLLTRNFPIRGTEGNMIVIDHGSGVLSLYLHLSKFQVKPGDLIGPGDQIGLSGATPRGTPPHLHLMVKVHGVNVDPLEFIKTYNEIFNSGYLR